MHSSLNSSLHRNLVFDTIDDLARLTSPPQVAATFSGAAAKFGFGSLGINDLPRPGEGANPVIPAESTPSGFRDCYIEERFYLVDHIAAHARATYEPFRYAEAPYPRALARDHERFKQALDTFGMGRGLIVPLGRTANIPACVWLAGENPDLDDDANRAIQLIALFAAAKARVLFRPPDAGPQLSPLTPRERDVLTWVAQGKSAWQIGEILNIAKRTVDEHTKNATRKLGALNRTHAVAIALRDQVIKP
jgi:LuxR family transcriptional regulator, quorum-sensing system regulator BjaR1